MLNYGDLLGEKKNQVTEIINQNRGDLLRAIQSVDEEAGQFSVDLETVANRMTSILNPYTGINTLVVPEGIIYRRANAYQHVSGEREIQSGWFETCRIMEQENPGVIIWRPQLPAWANEKDRKQEHSQIIFNLKSKIGFQSMFERLSGADIQMYGYFQHPQYNKPALTPESLVSTIGLKHNTSIDKGKILKRMGIFGIGHGAHAEINQDGRSGWLDGMPIRALTHSRPQADGALWLSQEFAQKLCEMTGIKFTPDLTRLQCWILTPQGLIKGMGMIQQPENTLPEETWIDWSEQSMTATADILMPSESLDTKFMADNMTILKVIPHYARHDKNKLKAFDGLLRMPETIKRFDQIEILDEAQEHFSHLNASEIHFAINLLELPDPNLNPEFDPEFDEDVVRGDQLGSESIDHYEINRMIRSFERRAYNENLRKFCSIFSEPHNYNLFAAPEIMEMASGQLSRSFTSRLRRWTRNYGNSDDILPGSYISAVRAYWTDPLYAGVKEPSSGYCKLILRQALNGDQVIDGIAMNGHDYLSELVRVKSDGGDLDDLLDAIYCQKGNGGNKFLWLIRNPTSWDGGWAVKLDDEDSEKLNAEGYYCYNIQNVGYHVQLSNQGLKVRQF